MKVYFYIKKKMSITEQQIIDIVNKYDPIGLIECGCPHDEYKFEVKDICKYLKSVKQHTNINELGEAIHSIFISAFDSSLVGSLVLYEEIAGEILALSK